MHARAEVVGRETELAAIEAFVERGGDEARALVLTGGPGIGKTTLWQAGVETALARGAIVLAARPSEAEAKLAHAALADLLHDVDADVLAALPGPQLHALEVALLRAEPGRLPFEPRAIAAGLLQTLRELAARSPVVVALDDVQWLDRSSANSLAFVARRLEHDAVAFLLTERSGMSSQMTNAFEARLERLDVGALSFGATRRLLQDRLGFSPSRHALRQIHESTRGNPLFALEVGRMLAERGPAGIDDEVPVPGRVEDLLGIRLARLPPPVRKTLLAVALSGDLGRHQLEAVVDPKGVDGGLDAGLLAIDGERIRASHPLLAAAARARSRASERRALHLVLAAETDGEERRARHLALAATAPDADLAATISAAASTAGARGGAEDALELAGHALRLTPPESSQWPDRVLTLCDLLLITGERERLDELLSVEQARLPSGAPQARAHLLRGLSGWASSHADEFGHHLDRALVESAGDPVLHAAVTALRVRHHAFTRVERIGEAESWALEALPAARVAGAAVERDVLQALAWVRVLRGKPIDDLCQRFDAVSTDAFDIFRSTDRAAAERLALRGDVNGARGLLEDLLTRADERGEMNSYVFVRLQLCELELRAGAWEVAERLLDEWQQSPDGRLMEDPPYERCRALLAAGLGRPDEAWNWAERAVTGSEARGWRLSVLEALRARGLAALLSHDATRAAESLRTVWEHTEREGVEEPAMFPVAPDLVEVLVELGETEEALAVTGRVRQLAEDQEHPWGLATSKRCLGVVHLALGVDVEQATAHLGEAAVAFGELGLRFDRARTLLLLGRGTRRLKKWGVARSALEEAVAAFEELGSAGWAAEARSDLDRVGARRPYAPGALTPAERRVAELAAEGLANKEIAARLVVTVHTVEVHLSHAYAKLGVRSRSQLRARLAGEA